ncbi:MAG: GTP 3',8-cyclase MoaA [Dictyoglomaceae bacterium]
MKDRFGREINYLRISLTDRCNFNCVYCKVKDTPLIPKENILSFEEIEEIIKVMAELGIKYIRLTGGEPLLRREIESLIYRIKNIPGIETVGITTNGYLLEEKAKDIFEAGLDYLNVSLDSLNKEVFSKITQGGDLAKVIKGIKTAKKYAKNSIKINIVITKYLPFELKKFTEFAKENNLILRFIELMPVKDINYNDLYIPASIIEKKLREISPLELLNESFGHGPSKYYFLRNLGIKIGFIFALSYPFCNKCNRLRLTSEGILLPCLNSNFGINLKDILRRNGKEGVLIAVQKIILNKPFGHRFHEEKIAFKMNRLGG